MAIQSVSLLKYSSAITVDSIKNTNDNQLLVTKGYIADQISGVTASVTLVGNGGLGNDGDGIYVKVDDTTIEKDSTDGVVKAKTAAVSSSSSQLVTGSGVYTYITDNSVSAYDANKKGYLVKTDSSTGKISLGLLPDLNINNVFTATSTGTGTGGMRAAATYTSYGITPDIGDVCLVTVDEVVTAYILTKTPYTTDGNWVKLNTPSNSVVSITGNASGSAAATGGISIANAKTTSNSITINTATDGSDSANATLGLASFNSSHFSVSSGYVSIQANTFAPHSLVSTVSIHTGNTTIHLPGTMGDAGQLLKVNGDKSGYEWFTPSYLTDHQSLANYVTKTTYAQDALSANAGKIGVSSFNSTSFSVGNLGFVSLNPAGTAASALGGVYVDNSTIGVESDGKIKVIGSYAAASNGDHVPTYTTNDKDKVLTVNSAGNGFGWASIPSLTAATTSVLGGVIVGNGLSVTTTGISEGTISVKPTGRNITVSSGGVGFTIPVIPTTGGYNSSTVGSSFGVGDVIYYDDNPYICKKAISGLGGYAAGTQYSEGQYSYYQGKFYEYISTTAASGKSPATVANIGVYWNNISPGTADGSEYWQPLGPSYYVNSSTSLEVDTTTHQLEVKSTALASAAATAVASVVKTTYGTVTGAGSSDIEVPHALGTQNIVVQVYYNDSGSRVPVLVDFSFGGLSSHASDLTNYITLHFAESQANTKSYSLSSRSIG